jgi:hypothetical protein
MKRGTKVKALVKLYKNAKQGLQNFKSGPPFFHLKFKRSVFHSPALCVFV